jgi:hypothetical protein
MAPAETAATTSRTTGNNNREKLFKRRVELAIGITTRKKIGGCRIREDREGESPEIKGFRLIL